MNNCKATQERLWDKWLLESVEFYEFNESSEDETSNKIILMDVAA